MPIPTDDTEHSLAVKLLLDDGYSSHVVDSGLRLTHSQVNRLGFDKLKADLAALIRTYQQGS